MTAGVVKITLRELCEGQGLSRTAVVQMVEYDVVRPIAGSTDQDWEFDPSAAHWAQRAARLRDDLDLDWVAVAMLVDLLRQREALDRENRLLRRRLARFLNDW